MRLAIITSLLCYYASFSSCFSQTQNTSYCYYPNEMVLLQAYRYSTHHDSLTQTLEVTAIGNGQINYSITTQRKEPRIISGSETTHHTGTARWRGCYGAFTSDGAFYPDHWEYLSKDGILIITLFGEDLGAASLELTRFIGERMIRQ